MRYSLGVDLGTTYTAAAIQRDQRLEIVDLGTRSASIPSLVYLREDGTVLTGDAAARRGATDPTRLAREFKRRMGDTTAILLGGVPYSVDALMASMLRSVVSTVSERQGEPPSAVAIAHPANWGQYKKDLLDQAVRRADIDHAVMVTEPEAAAVHYATLERIEPGATVAVYDLGGGTFDAAVVRATGNGFELIGEPEGIERLGGIDFDEAVFRHVIGALRGAQGELDPDDPVAQAAVSRLRDECVAAKEALSTDTEVSIPVMLPAVQTEVRLTRAEFEAMIRPALGDTVVVLRRALRSAGVAADELHSVLLVGGSSRIPLISQLVTAELGRPVALDVHPKHSVALGAAAVAGGTVELKPATAPVVAPVAAAAAVAAVAADPSSELPAPPPAPPAPIVQPEAVTEPVPYAPPAVVEPGSGGGGRKWAIVAAAVVGVAVLGTVAALALGGGGDDDEASDATVATTAVVTTVPATTVAPTATTAAPSTSAPAPATTQPVVATNPTSPPTTTPIDPCLDVTEPCVLITGLTITPEGAVEVSWEPRNFEPDVVNGYHAHLFWNSFTAAQASTDADPSQIVDWDAVDETVHTSQQVLLLSNRPPDATGVCAATGIAPAHIVPNKNLVHCVLLPEGSI